MPIGLCDRNPQVDPARLLSELVPPPRFQRETFDSYRPDPAQPSQQQALDRLRAFAADLDRRWSRQARPTFLRWLRRRPEEGEARARLEGSEPASVSKPPGLYLDGGYGVGKTHLLAALWHEAPAPKLFATFVELTHLVGALGFHHAVEELAAYTLVCVDEFELDDPGDTVLVSTLLARLRDAGVRIAATSNTLPDKLGEGRFATADFMREIQGLSTSFESVRIDGEDYRQRGMPDAPQAVDLDTVRSVAASSGASLDHFVDLTRHLSQVHPWKYGALLDGVSVVCLEDVRTVDDQAAALRLVVLADRMYDRDLPVVASGVPLDELFAPELLAGGYRKKYFRAISRLVALAREGSAAPG